MEGCPVVLLDGVVVSDKDRSVITLGDTVDIVAAQPRRSIFFLEDSELVPVVLVQSITRGNPDKAVSVLKHLIGKVAGKLVVCIIQFSSLRYCYLIGEDAK